MRAKCEAFEFALVVTGQLCTDERVVARLDNVQVLSDRSRERIMDAADEFPVVCGPTG